MSVPDSDLRKQAVSDHSNTLIVEAGAGTGKTALMAGRIALLLVAEVEPRHIAAITFTEVAASDLLLRVTKYVDTLSSGAVPEPLQIALPGGISARQQKRIAKARTSLDELTCTTIHGFCRQLIRPYPVECSMDPGAAVMNEADTELAYEFEFRSWLRQRLNTGPSDDPVALAIEQYGDTAVKVLREIAEVRRRWRGAAPDHPPLPSQAVQELLAAIDEFARYYDSCGISEPEKVGNCVAEFMELRQFFSQGLAPEDTLEKTWNFSAPPRLSIMHKDETTFKDLRAKGKFVTAGKKVGRAESECARIYGDLEDRCARVGEALGRVVGGCAELIIARLVESVGEFDLRYEEYKRIAALIDFDDMLYSARDLLRDHPEVRGELRRRYTHLLVDEFQDTDPIQCEILFYLCGDGAEGTPWLDRRLAPGSLFLVGDPKQSIYRFRRADLETYRRVRDRVQACGGGVVPVTANFRSRPQILEFVNARFANPLSTLGFAPLQATVKDGDGVQHVKKLEIPPGGDGTDSADERRLREARAIAELCSSLPGRLVVRQPEGKAPCRFQDIALLAPSNTNLWIYERELEDRGVPVASQAGKALFLRQETHDLIAIARVLSSSRDTLALGALLRGPLVGLSEEELLDTVEALRRDAQGKFGRLTLWTPSDLIPNPVARKAVQILQGLARRAYNTTPFDILSAAVEELRVRPLLVQLYPGHADRALANVEQFLEMARPFGTRGLRSFVQFVTSRWQESKAAAEGREDSAGDAVQLITIHGAKGLEWPVVVAANMVTEPAREKNQVLLETQRNAVRARLGHLEPPSYIAARQTDDAQEAEQRKRLWYVLCTRARDLLVLPNHTTLPARCWLNELELNIASLPAIQFDESVGAPLPTPVATVNEQDADAFAREAGRIAASTRHIRWVRPSGAEPDEPQLGQPSPEVPEQLAEATEVRGTAARGKILHKIMEELLNGLIEDSKKALVARAAELLRQLSSAEGDLTPEAISCEEVADTVARTLALDLVQRLRNSLLPEIPVYGLKEAAQHLDAHVGVADAVATNETGNAFYVLDWKSTVSPTTEDVQKHSAQLRLYLNLLNVSTGALVYMTTGQVLEVSRGG